MQLWVIFGISYMRHENVHLIFAWKRSTSTSYQQCGVSAYSNRYYSVCRSVRCIQFGFMSCTNILTCSTKKRECRHLDCGQSQVNNRIRWENAYFFVFRSRDFISLIVLGKKGIFVHLTSGTFSWSCFTESLGSSSMWYCSTTNIKVYT